MKRRADLIDRRGAAIMEVLIGFVLLAVAAVALMQLLGQTSRTMEDVARIERDTEAATRVLERLSIASHRDISGFVGSRAVGPFVLTVLPVGPVLFNATVSDTATGVAVARTTFYLPDSVNVAPF